MLNWLVLAGTIVGQLLALYLPGSPEPSAPLFPGDDKVVHLVLFLLPALALGRITRAWWPLGLLGLHAVISEWVQLNYIPHRSGDVLDVLADVLGIALGDAYWRWRDRRGYALDG
ncbi:VanZ family protein [Tessaracoccus sp. OH4464_COT-324]|uniref:VanZ family protein n=1 Tax=Tessaracoccus sp. OH4464_COT-324 TaxID=2491059 RepID=UPI000F63BE2F|nr:VanZ family protein [Tessaracoccus sp. OH4464_COT-324]RRD46724.1 VanZ family protein [Tessaracoccus sp. OH4464_COT-324]